MYIYWSILAASRVAGVAKLARDVTGGKVGARKETGQRHGELRSFGSLHGGIGWQKTVHRSSFSALSSARMEVA